MQRFTELRVWRASMKFALDVYEASDRFPHHEQYGLTSQLRRAAHSIHANIAEGARRVNGTDYARFLNIAQGSLAEVESFLFFARKRGYLDEPAAQELMRDADVIGHALERLRQAVLRGAGRQAG